MIYLLKTCFFFHGDVSLLEAIHRLVLKCPCPRYLTPTGNHGLVEMNNMNISDHAMEVFNMGGMVLNYYISRFSKILCWQILPSSIPTGLPSGKLT